MPDKKLKRPDSTKENSVLESIKDCDLIKASSMDLAPHYPSVIKSHKIFNTDSNEKENEI